MKKIVAYVGSRRGVKSNTFYFVTRILEQVKSKRNIEFDIVTPFDHNIQFCSGCQFCFKNAYCIREKKDDLLILQEKYYRRIL
ncbi:hypothetical protein J7E73_10505 [Paenibacillus albidus]|uniref:NAD(P)H-dependent oxidoreductase n=1 Tax=Paenibacillus albidus TaxID=2041023 RepID=UPI001BE94BBB|nr:hypothetical protein [Paenibacillus albidus]